MLAVRSPFHLRCLLVLLVVGSRLQVPVIGAGWRGASSTSSSASLAKGRACQWVSGRCLVPPGLVEVFTSAPTRNSSARGPRGSRRRRPGRVAVRRAFRGGDGDEGGRA